MGYLLLLTALLINLIGAYANRFRFLFASLTILIMWLLFGWNNNNPDYYNYLKWYDEIYYAPGFAIEGKDIGFKLIMNITSFIGLDYNGFLIVISLIGFILIHNTIKMYAPNPSLVYLLYLIFPFLLDVVQVRNFFMMSIVIFSYRYLIEGNKKSFVKFLICLIIAFSIHSAAIIYLPLVLINKKIKKVYIQFLIIVTMFLSAIILINGNKIPYIQNVIGFFTENDYIIGWFDKSTDFGFLLFWAMHIITLLILKYSIIIIKSKQTNLKDSEVQFAVTIYWTLLVGLLWFPFYMVSIEFTRILRNLFIMIFIVFSIANKALVNDRIERKMFYNLMIILFTMLFFLIQLYIPHYETVIKPVLENNKLWINN